MAANQRIYRQQSTYICIITPTAGFQPKPHGQKACYRAIGE